LFCGGRYSQAVAAVTGASGEALGQAARALVSERFDIERVADRYEALYARLLGQP
jgi:glycosyltransferase involved in cell wall biosynthesis